MRRVPTSAACWCRLDQPVRLVADFWLGKSNALFLGQSVYKSRASDQLVTFLIELYITHPMTATANATLPIRSGTTTRINFGNGSEETFALKNSMMPMNGNAKTIAVSATSADVRRTRMRCGVCIRKPNALSSAAAEGGRLRRTVRPQHLTCSGRTLDL